MKKIEKIGITHTKPPKGFKGIYKSLPIIPNLGDVFDKLNELIERVNLLSDNKK